ncbi:hypothetical protein [Burkholderia humptydooensis]|uniref:hypothetical protein n=1 Tax=Burkholderia humptydooensis TaxID=430531 RepID=UPI0010FEADE8|nr:hypothetical protein [Burkholderia humptydooensis]
MHHHDHQENEARGIQDCAQRNEPGAVAIDQSRHQQGRKRKSDTGGNINHAGLKRIHFQVKLEKHEEAQRK